MNSVIIVLPIPAIVNSVGRTLVKMLGRLSTTVELLPLAVRGIEALVMFVLPKEPETMAHSE
jgi:hypothetical protein